MSGAVHSATLTSQRQQWVALKAKFMMSLDRSQIHVDRNQCSSNDVNAYTDDPVSSNSSAIDSACELR